MIQNNHDAIIDKIKKLLALSQSPNQAEAERAAEKAQELLTKYDLSMDELGINEKVEEQIVARYQKSPSKWRLVLINTISEFYFCKFIIIQSPPNFMERTTYFFDIIGKPHHISIAFSIYDYIEKTVARISREKCRRNAKSKFRESFRYGMAVEICMRLRMIMHIRENGDPGSETALIVKEDKDVQDYIKAMDLTETKIKMSANRSAFERGIDAGAGVSLNKQIKNDRYAIGQ